MAGQDSLSGEVTADVLDALVDELAEHRRDELRRLECRARIQRALTDPAALTIVFQKIYALKDKRVVAVEVLARFHAAPRRGPEKWFAEADQVGLRTELELKVIAMAIQRLEDIPAQLHLSLNVSPATIHAPALRKLLAPIAKRVIIEVTEHASIDDYSALNRRLAGLRALGVRLAVDDAGAGFASLRHILQLAPEFIKLDNTLTAGIDSDRSEQALAAGLISFADKSGSAIIAEGIERKQQLNVLRKLGVTYGQGYHLSRPAPLARQRPDREYAGVS